MSFTPLDCCSSSSFPACSLLCRSAGLEDPRGPDASTPRRDQVLAQRGKGALTDLVTAVCVCVCVCVCVHVCVCVSPCCCLLVLALLHVSTLLQVLLLTLYTCFLRWAWFCIVPVRDNNLISCWKSWREEKWSHVSWVFPFSLLLDITETNILQRSAFLTALV